MLSKTIVDNLEEDTREIKKFRDLLIEAGLGTRFNKELYTLSGLLGKVEAIIQLSREGKI